jgi:hypothetical protein
MELNEAQKERLAQSGQGFKPTAKADRAQPKTQDQSPPQALALPGQEKVLLEHAIARTQTQIAAVDRIVDKSKAVVLAHFDRRMADAPGEMALEMMSRMGIDPDSPEAADFFDPTPIDIEAEFDKLLAPKVPALAPQSGASQGESEAQRVFAEVV